MAMLDLSQLSGLPLLPNGMLSLPQTQGFDPTRPPDDPAAEAQAAREAASARLAGGQKRPPEPFGPFPGVPLPGMLGDITPQDAPALAQGAPQGGALPPWLQDSLSTPTGIGAPFGALSPQAAPQKPGGPSLDEMAYGQQPTSDTAIPPNATFAAGGPMPGAAPPQAITPAPQPAPAPSFRDNFKSKLDTIAGILSPQMRERQIQNQTVSALKKAGMSDDMATAIAGNPRALQDVLISMAGGKKPIVMNNMLVSPDTGAVIADHSEASQWKPITIKRTNGDEETWLHQASTNSFKPPPSPVGPNSVPIAGGPASANMTLPPQVQRMTPAVQFRDAPDGSTGMIGGRPVIRRAGRWEYQ